MCKIKVVICDDSVHVCRGYQMYIDRDEDMECIGTANDSEGCMHTVEELEPDLLLLDIQMESEKTGINLIPALKDLMPNMKIIMLTSYDDSQYIFLSILNGADGYVIKDADGEKVINEIKKIYNTSLAKPAKTDAMDVLKDETRVLYESHKSFLYVMNNMVKLSVNEYEILKDIYNGLTYKKIAEKKVVEEGTVKTSASRIVKKFEIGSMKELIKILKKLKIFDYMQG